MLNMLFIWNGDGTKYIQTTHIQTSTQHIKTGKLRKIITIHMQSYYIFPFCLFYAFHNMQKRRQFTNILC